MTYTSTVQESTKDLPLIGYHVFAILDKSLEISFADLRQKVTPLGFGADDLLPPEPEPRTYIRRAITAWLREIATSGAALPVELLDEDEETGRKKKPLVREIKNRDKRVLTLALVKENIDLDALGLSYLTNLRVFYVKPLKEKEQPEQPGKLTLTLTPSGATDPHTYTPDSREQALIADLQKHVDYYSTIYKVEELRRMVVKIIETMKPAKERPDGGVYFVPYQNRDKVIRLKTLVEQGLSSSTGKNKSILMHFIAPDETSTREQVAGAAHQSFLDKTEAMKKKVMRVLEDAENKKRGIRKDAMEARLVEMDGLKQELDLYHRLLGVHREEIEASITEMETQARELLGLYAIGVKREREETRTTQAANVIATTATEEEEDDEDY